MTIETTHEPEDKNQNLLSERLDYWNNFFNSNTYEDFEHIEHFGHLAITELDELWKQLGNWGLDSYIKEGQGCWTETVHIDELTEDDARKALLHPTKEHCTILRSGATTDMRGYSQGFGLIMSQNIPPHLTYQFERSRESDFVLDNSFYNFRLRHQINVKLGTLSYIAYADLETAAAEFIASDQ